MPFSDDINLSALPDLSGSLFLLDVFANPPRCRFSEIGRQITDRYGANIAGSFADEIETRPPLNHICAQFSATVEDAAPTFYRYELSAHRPGSYMRLLLPLWGSGRINLILGAVTQS